MTKICGIIDFSDRSSTDINNLIKDMTKVMKHEGWHDKSTYSKDGIAFGNVSIDKEKKIVWNKDKTKCLIFSGIVYGKNINQILSNYENIDFIRNLNGIFTFSVFDFRKNKIATENFFIKSVLNLNINFLLR